MSDPGGGHGWRSARHLPRRRGGVFALGRLADRTAPGPSRPLAVLLLPQPLEAIVARERLEDLLAGPGVVAVDPARISYRALSRLPEAVHAGLATGQARRLSLPGTPRALLLFGALQYPLARSLRSEHPDAQLWAADPLEPVPEDASARVRRRVDDLATMAAMRADVRFPWPGAELDDPHAANAGLWERIEPLGIESGRLGSERPDVRGGAG